MNRWLGASILYSLVAVALAACSDSSSGGYYMSGPSSGGSYCSQYTSCGTCTPVQGCGWCFTRSGGMCASGPDECASSQQEFTWTWNASGCPGVDAGVGSVDAGAAPADGSARGSD